jgi:hypothetical protein
MAAAPDPRTACASTDAPYLWAARIQTLLECSRFNLTTEYLTQADIEASLLAELATEDVRREHRLGAADRPDFFVKGAVVIEVKGPRHRAPAVERQLARYAAYPEVRVILLATSRAMRLPAAIGGKPVRVINLGRAWL